MDQARRVPEAKSISRKRTRAVVACADREIQKALVSVLSEFGVQPVLTETLDLTKTLMAQDGTAMVFTQPKFRKGSFSEVLDAAYGQGRKVPVVVCSAFYDKNIYIDAMSRGAFDYLAFPYRHEEVAWVVAKALGRSTEKAGGSA